MEKVPVLPRLASFIYYPTKHRVDIDELKKGVIELSTIIVTVLSVIFAGRYFTVLNNNVYSRPEFAARKKAAKEAAFKMLAALIVANILTNLVTMPKSKIFFVIALILALIYFAFLLFLIINVKLWNDEVPVYDEDGKKKKDKETGEELKELEPNKWLAVRQLFAIVTLGIPMAVNCVYAKAAIAGLANPWKTIKGFLWAFALPLIFLVIASLIQFFILSNGLTTVGEWLMGKTDDAPDRPTRAADDFEDISSRSPWYQRVNWPIVGSIAGVITVAIICGILLMKTFV